MYKLSIVLERQGKKYMVYTVYMCYVARSRYTESRLYYPFHGHWGVWDGPRVRTSLFGSRTMEKECSEGCGTMSLVAVSDGVDLQAVFMSQCDLLLRSVMVVLVGQSKIKKMFNQVT